MLTYPVELIRRNRAWVPWRSALTNWYPVTGILQGSLLILCCAKKNATELQRNKFFYKVIQGKREISEEWDWMGSSTMLRQKSDHWHSMLAVDRRGKNYKLQVSMMAVDRSGKNYRWWLLKWQPLDEDDFCTFFLTIITTSTISCKQKGVST